MQQTRNRLCIGLAGSSTEAADTLGHSGGQPLLRGRTATALDLSGTALCG
jgi:hypothetical protein